MTEPSPIETFDQASLESFTSELVVAGFEPDPGTALRNWTGPAHPSLASLTDVQQMRLVIRDGWPIVFPVLLAEGLHTNHLTAAGYVCLWHDGDGSQEWVTLDGIYNRLSQWCDAAQNGWDHEGLARDAYLNFQPKAPAVDILDLDELRLGAPGTRGSFHGKLDTRGSVSLRLGSRSEMGDLQGLWYSVGHLEVPPRNLTELLGALTRHHARNLNHALASRRNDECLQPSGSVDLILFSWKLGDVAHLLVLAIAGRGNETTALALQVGPTDRQSLLLRAGPDSTTLSDKTVTVFGLGALGGHVAVLLAQSGIACLRLHDGDVLLPENVVRHAGGHMLVGTPKVVATEVLIRDHAPWTEVSLSTSSPLAPNGLTQAIAGSDLVVDATGVDASTLAICLCAHTQSTVLVSGALYRGGSVARIRRQGTPGDTPILERATTPGYLVIPPSTEDHLIHPSVGCSGPVHNAPPSDVLAAAALIVQAAVDALTGRLLFPDEVIDVYRPLPDEPPFDRVGRLPQDTAADQSIPEA